MNGSIWIVSLNKGIEVIDYHDIEVNFYNLLANSNKGFGEKKMSLVNDVGVLFMMGHDEFTSREICLHYLVSSSNVDDVIFPACIGKLNGVEIMRLLSLTRYPSLRRPWEMFDLAATLSWGRNMIRPTGRTLEMNLTSTLS
ncbi:hypothetical protein Tco_0632663 [Tanacetum coccineum]